MSNTINSNGNNVGTVTGSEAEYELQRESRGAVRPSTYNSADAYPLAGGDRVRSLIYPQNGGNNHYVRFSINLNEESRLIKSKQVGIVGDANLSDQMRLNRNMQTQDAFNGAGAILGAYGGAKVTGAIVGKNAAALKNLFKGKFGQTAAVGTLIGAGAIATGQAVGERIGEIATAYLKVTNKLKRLTADITLYTPGNVRANYNLNYDMPEDILVALAQSDNYDAIKAGLDAAGTGITGAGKDIWHGNFRQGASQAGAVAGDVGELAGKAARILGARSSTVSMLSRTAVNVRRDVMFKHVGNRQFVFEYTFAPKSVTEAKEVADIIFMFKYFAHPEMLQGYGNFLYLYPAEFDIEYGIVPENANVGPTQPKRNEYLNKISSCVLTDIDVNYAPGSNAFQSLEQGEPVITTLSLVFKEIETLHRERIAQGY